MELLLATEDLKKIREYRLLFAPLESLYITTLRMISLKPSSLIEGEVFEGMDPERQASLLATYLQRTVLVDLSYLLVPAISHIDKRRTQTSNADNLQSRELSHGPHSKFEPDGGLSRGVDLLCGGEEVSDRDRRATLLSLLRGKMGEERAACFVCTIAVASPGGVVRSATARCEGRILDEERGVSSSYDSLFAKNYHSKSFAELEERVRLIGSARYKAFNALFPTLERLFNLSSGF